MISLFYMFGFSRPEHYSSESYSSPGTSQQQYQEQTTNFDNQVQFEQPMTPATPANMRITRNTRARLRGIFVILKELVINDAES